MLRATHSDYLSLTWREKTHVWKLLFYTWLGSKLWYPILLPGAEAADCRAAYLDLRFFVGLNVESDPNDLLKDIL